MNIDKVLQNKKFLFATLLLLIVALFIILIKNKPLKINKDKKNDYTSNEALEKAKEYEKKYPIIKILPLIYAHQEKDYTNYREFRIDGGRFSECERDFCLMITDSTGGNKKIAINEIRKNGYNPDDYEIIYKENL